MNGVRLATAADVPALADLLAAAFEGYVWTDWAFPAENRRRRQRESFAMYLGVTVSHLGQVWMTEDGTSAAAWLSPQPAALPDDLSGHLGDLGPRLLGDRAKLVAAADEIVGARHRQEPRWYLATMGTSQHARGRGLGAAVLAPVLQHCDRDGTAAALETSTEDNVRFYERLGFTVTGEVDPPGGAPHVWVMRRAPDPNAALR